MLDLKNARPPLPYELGWKDTVITYPGEVTRIAVRWDTTDTPPAADPAAAVGTSNFPFDPTALINGVGYVWHCHIVDHEDNEMMRNYIVGTARQSVCDPAIEACP
jgi:FtsP/CotA-like multicopper oxidase with cupredoxin domain